MAAPRSTKSCRTRAQPRMRTRLPPCRRNIRCPNLRSTFGLVERYFAFHPGDFSFDFAISEYGAAIWCDPYVWIPEARRLLRPGGELVFFQNSTLAMLCTPADGSAVGRRLERDYFDLHRLDWRDAAIDPGGVEFALPVSAWLRLFRETGFDVLDFREVQAPRAGPDVRYTVSADWARRWPAEQVWNLRRRP